MTVQHDQAPRRQATGDMTGPAVAFRGPRSPWRRAAVELFGLSLVAWAVWLWIHLSTGSDPTGGVNVAPFEGTWWFSTYIGPLLLFVVLPGLALIVLAIIICLLRWRRPRDYWWAYRVAFVLMVIWLVVGNYGTWYAVSRALGEREAVAQSKEPNTAVVPIDVVATVTRQSGEGMTDDQIDTGFVERVAEYSVERLKEASAQRVQATGGTPIPEIRSEATVFESGTKRFGVIKLRTQGVASAVIIVGLQGGNFVRVSCISKGLREVPTSYGPCDAKIKEVFGQSLVSFPSR